MHESFGDVCLAMKQYWGYESFRPLQREAMECVLAGRDSMVVLPTGGGKSLCFQAPAVAMPGMAVVVSPLISLMKDQVDQLQASGVPAACIHSGMTAAERMATHRGVREGSLHLLYVAPERIVKTEFIEYLHNANVSFFVVDEAHCISQWGHDFRPEYRALRVLREAFPEAAFHAYTATATPPVREDVARELGLRTPEVLVGSFDRPNLLYRAERRTDGMAQVLQILTTHQNDSCIVYCISRRRVEEVCARLREAGYAALPYHAGLDDSTRKNNQEAFIRDEARIIVATVAFGMGIDKPDVRCVIHAEMPKSIEHYQQESGRAGRDGLDAECWILYSGSDFRLWQSILEKSDNAAAVETARKKLDNIFNFCTRGACRHRTLLAYFGEGYLKDSCGACDFCLDEKAFREDSSAITDTILRCVASIGSFAGPSYTTSVLVGDMGERVTNKGHHHLDTHGTLKQHGAQVVRDWIEQLVAQGVLRKEGQYNILSVAHRLENASARLAEVERPHASKRKGPIKSQAEAGYDIGLFDALRALRRELAESKSVPPYVIFGDATLRDMARRKPVTPEQFIQTPGVGEHKQRVFGKPFLAAIREYCGLPPGDKAPSNSKKKRAFTAEQARLFSQGGGIDEYSEMMHEPPSRVLGMLLEYIETTGATEPAIWVNSAVAERILDAAQEAGPNARTLRILLAGEASEADIRICVACLKNRATVLDH